MALNVLVVDDSETMRGMIGKTLRLAEVPLGELHEAGDGKQALELLRKNWVDLIFLDVNMPVMSGHEMVVEMTRDEELKTIPIILLTSEGSTTRVEEMKALGVKAYLRKPCTPEAVRSAVEHVVGKDENATPEAVVETVVRDVLQNLAYTICDPVAKDQLRAPQGPILRATMSFRGPLAGTLSLLVPEDLSLELASNLLGMESAENCTPELARDSLSEVVNVTCGHILTALAGEGPAFDLTVPSVEEVGPSVWAEYSEDPVVRAFSTEGGPLLVRQKLEEAGA